MSKINNYRERLKQLDHWLPYLKRNSGLPGPRANLELARAVVEAASEKQIEEFLAIPPQQARENTPEVFVVFCGVAAIGKLIADGKTDHFTRLCEYAVDPRWRIREATAIALQRVGDQDMGLLLTTMRSWCKGNWLQKRAVAAGLAEPRLLQDSRAAHEVLSILDEITQAMASAEGRSDRAYRVLRQTMGYCWSVAVAALPDAGKPLMEKWTASRDPDIRWIIRENLKKNRLVKMDADWVTSCRRKTGPR